MDSKSAPHIRASGRRSWRELAKMMKSIAIGFQSENMFPVKGRSYSLAHINLFFWFNQSINMPQKSRKKDYKKDLQSTWTINISFSFFPINNQHWPPAKKKKIHNQHQQSTSARSKPKYVQKEPLKTPDKTPLPGACGAEKIGGRACGAPTISNFLGACGAEKGGAPAARPHFLHFFPGARLRRPVSDET